MDFKKYTKPLTPRQAKFASWEHKLVSKYVHTKKPALKK